MVTGTGALFQPLVGLLLDLAWKGQTSPLGARLYEADDYRLALGSIARLLRDRLRLAVRRARDLLPGEA